MYILYKVVSSKGKKKYGLSYFTSARISYMYNILQVEGLSYIKLYSEQVSFTFLQYPIDLSIRLSLYPFYPVMIPMCIFYSTKEKYFKCLLQCIKFYFDTHDFKFFHIVFSKFQNYYLFFKSILELTKYFLKHFEMLKMLKKCRLIFKNFKGYKKNSENW